MVQPLGVPAAQPTCGRPMSVEEWEQLDEDEPGELVEGRLQEEEVPDFPHELVVSGLLYVLLHWARARKHIVLSVSSKSSSYTAGGTSAPLAPPVAASILSRVAMGC